jgi:hypothetical protein
VSNTETHFEQIPVETVKKICQERIRRRKERVRREELLVQQAVAQNEPSETEQSILQR